ncbi:MAG: hypothetical protein HY938_08965 [Nitrosomonadales bacterium]|nr:hypothetical protein [Nitrosomonadales bacterium]
MRLMRDASIHVRLGLGLFLLLLIYDGALRKWVLPGAEQILFIAKDALLFGLLVYAMLNRSRQKNVAMQPAARVLFVLYAGWVLLESGNFNLPGILVGIWGLKAHLLYASLILLLPLAFSNLDDLFRALVKIYPWVVVPVCALAFVQLAAPADSFINQQVRGGMDMISYFGESGLVRITGTFSYITGMAAFVQVTTVLGVGLFLGGARTRLFLVGLGFALAALPATGSRAVIVVAAVSVLMMLIAALASRLIGMRMTIRTVAVIAILVAISLQAQDAAWVALQQRAESAAETFGDTGRVFTAFTNAFGFFDVAGLFGFGSGSTNYGAFAFVTDAAPFSWLPAGIYFEEESGRLVLELGMLGWLFSQAMRIALFFWSVRLAMKGLTRAARVAGVLALPVMALGMYHGNGVFAPPVGASYYWFCVALLAMAQFEHKQAWAERARLRGRQLQAAVAR